MHILVTDSLICTHCGPDFGLILLANEMQERRVIDGWLGCSNCRERYPIVGGYGDLRPSPRKPERTVSADPSDDPGGALKLAALLGVTEGPGQILLLGPSVRHAHRIAAMIEGVEVIAVHPSLREQTQSAGVTRLATGDQLPFRSGVLRGVVLEGEPGGTLLREGLRVLSSGSRIVLMNPPTGGESTLLEGGCELLLEADSMLVGLRK